MNLKLTNIGKIRQADINMKGLTVIAGLNDSGKSTIGKVLFVTIKALVNTLHRSSNNKERVLRERISTLYERIGELRFTSEQLNRIMPTTIEAMGRKLLAMENQESRMNYLNEIISIIGGEELTPRVRSLIIADLNKINSVLNEDSRFYDIKTEMNNLLESEFLGSFTTVGEETSEVTLTMDEGKSNLSYRVKENKTDMASVTGPEIFLDDVTYVESSLYLHMLQSILRSRNISDAESVAMMRGLLPEHVVDMAEKIHSAGLGLTVSDKTTTEMNLEKIIDGKFAFDPNSGSLKFQRNGVSFPIMNVASGIKSFGVIQLLLESGIISNNRLLEWDEPENHMHPEWQLNLAEVMIQLTKAGYPILITTHSPYFLQALRYFAAIYGIEKFVDYYLAEPIKDNTATCTVREVTNTLNDVFITLAEPLNKVLNVDRARKLKEAE